MTRPNYTMLKNLTPTLAECGKIKLGRKGETRTSKAGKEFQLPQKLDHFLITTMDRGPDGNFIRDETVHRIYGEKPAAIKISLLYNQIDLNIQTRLTCYKGRQIFCTGDNETASRLVKPGEFKEISCPCERIAPDYRGPDKCKMNGCLSCFIDGVNTLGGCYKFRTTSYNSITNILSSMAMIKMAGHGRLAEVPLELVCQAKSVANPVDGKQQTIHYAYIRYNGSRQALLADVARISRDQADSMAMIHDAERDARKLISSGDFMDEDTTAEFYPEQEQKVVAEENLADAKAQQEAAGDLDIYAPQTAPGTKKEAEPELPKETEKEAEPDEGIQPMGLAPEGGGHINWAWETIGRLRNGKYAGYGASYLTGLPKYIHDHIETWPMATDAQQQKAIDKWNGFKDQQHPFPVNDDGTFRFVTAEGSAPAPEPNLGPDDPGMGMTDDPGPTEDPAVKEPVQGVPTAEDLKKPEEPVSPMKTPSRWKHVPQQDFDDRIKNYNEILGGQVLGEIIGTECKATKLSEIPEDCRGPILAKLFIAKQEMGPGGSSTPSEEPAVMTLDEFKTQTRDLWLKVDQVGLCDLLKDFIDPDTADFGTPEAQVEEIPEDDRATFMTALRAMIPRE